MRRPATPAAPQVPLLDHVRGAVPPPSGAASAAAWLSLAIATAMAERPGVPVLGEAGLPALLA